MPNGICNDIEDNDVMRPARHVFRKPFRWLTGWLAGWLSGPLWTLKLPGLKWKLASEVVFSPGVVA